MSIKRLSLPKNDFFYFQLKKKANVFLVEGCLSLNFIPAPIFHGTLQTKK